MSPAINPEWLFKLRVAVARHGENDRARWWNTNKALSTTGALALRRNLPRTYMFAQARIVLAVAARRCREHYDLPNSVNLWDLPEALEEAVEASWGDWLDDGAAWAPFFDSLKSPAARDLTTLLTELGLVTDRELDDARSLRRSAEGRSVILSRSFGGTKEEVALLALGFDKGTDGLVVPYARLG
ncbi:BrxE family protein [Methylobacterium sp. 2A]|nr:BrxE family protein [Methylobacterium sp. 2A]